MGPDAFPPFFFISFWGQNISVFLIKKPANTGKTRKFGFKQLDNHDRKKTTKLLFLALALRRGEIEVIFVIEQFSNDCRKQLRDCD